MAAPSDTRILIVVFDALRPEFVTPELMPNLTAFADGGVRYDNHHAVFFTETRVNQSAVITGCMPAKHGFVANKFAEPQASPGEVLNTGDDNALEAAFKRMDGKLFDVPTLSELLAGHGKSYASFSAGTPGGGRLINHTAETNGTFRFAMRRPEAAPEASRRLVAERFGAMPAYDYPAKAWVTGAVDIYLDIIEADVRPDVMLLWLCEPDETFHYRGIGSSEARETIRHADAEFGRILTQHEAEIRAGRMQIIAMSDHGQITLDGKPLDVVQRLRDAGFRAGSTPGQEIDVTWAGASAGGLWVREHDPALTGELAEWLTQQKWCGPIFVREGVAGMLSLEAVGLNHRRAPDIAFAFRARDDLDGNGLTGLTLHNAPYPIGGGCHGGLSRQELNNFLSLSGSYIKNKTRIEKLPSGNVDIAPTVLSLLNLPVPDHMDGRVLLEALNVNHDDAITSSRDTVLEAKNAKGVRTYLSVSEIGETRYLNEAWVD